MDPISTFLNAYLFSISNNIQESYSKRSDVYVTPVVIEYKNTKIPFQHQIWRIKDKSVCFKYVEDTSVYSDCTIKAKSLFIEVCDALSKKKTDNWSTQKYKNMYCNAALSYKPTIAKIASGSSSKVNQADKKCNELILKAMGNKNKKLIAERDKVCEEARNEQN